MNNYDYFEYAKQHLEDMFDEYYAKNVVVIPDTSDKENDLTINNTKLIENISAFDVLRKQGKDIMDDSILKIINDIKDILVKTSAINFSAFTQYFMVHNVNFGIFKDLSSEEKVGFLYNMLNSYCEDRHGMYLSHGYSNVILQVMCDNYSHKRRSKDGINKMEAILSPLRLDKIAYPEGLLSEDNYYFLPDKGGADLFEEFLKKINIEMKSREIEHNKLPDYVFKYNDNYYICELKTMKQGGGGQDKQIVEIANFIRYQEKNENIHYITFLDSLYFNKIVLDTTPKMLAQKKDIEETLKKNRQNYFMNTKSMVLFVENLKN